MSDYVKVVQDAYRAFGEGDIAKVLSLLDENVEWYEAEHITYWPGGLFIGPQAVLEGVFARIPKDFEGFRVTVDRVVGFGETVLAQGRYSGKAIATGRKFDAQVAHIWDFRNGKVVRFQQYSDTWQFAQATGVTPVLNKVAGAA
jgi:uncharacterized protein